MNRRAANALRFLAILYSIDAIKSLVLGVLQDATIAKLRDTVDVTFDPHGLIDRLELIANITWIGHVGVVVLILACMVMLAMSLERGRALVITAIALLVAYLGFSIYEHLSPSKDPGAGMMAIWIVASASYGAAGMLPLFAAVRAVPAWKHRALAVAGGVTLIVLPVALDALMMFGDRYSPMWHWVYRGVDVVSVGWFVVFGVAIARALEHGAPAVPAATGPGAGLDGTALRTIGWAILVRVGVGVGFAIISIIGGMHGSYDSLATAAIGATVVGVITTVFLIIGLYRYARYPAPYGGAGPSLVIGLLVIGVILDIVGAKTTDTLFQLVAKAQHADSMWSMPSFSDLESMQATVVWTGRLSLVVGLVSMLILVGSVKMTARSVNAHALATTADVTMALMVIAAFGALAVGVWIPHVKRHDEPMLLAIALALVGVAIAALVNLMRVLFGVARAVETPQPVL
jgi:hypothetical protein